MENIAASEGYAHQKGIFPAREAVVMETQNKGIKGVTAEDVFMGNGVSELILMTLEAMLEPGDQNYAYWPQQEGYAIRNRDRVIPRRSAG